MVWDYCFLAVSAARTVNKKKLGADYEQLLRAVFSCFRYTILSELKCCVMFLFLISFWNKTGFLGLRTFLNVNVLHT